jgi:hypothetical protein
MLSKAINNINDAIMSHAKCNAVFSVPSCSALPPTESSSRIEIAEII